MSGELWFAEGVTTYYTDIILCRAGLMSPERFLEKMTRDFNYVWNSPGRQFYSPVGMSHQAVFLDGGVYLDPVNEVNTFIDYYSYGKVLGLALDLSLREKNQNLDDYMKLLWQKYGKPEIPYTNHDLQNVLSQYAGKVFADNFFNRYIYEGGMPDYESLFQFVGIDFKKRLVRPYIGAEIVIDNNGLGKIKEYTKIGSPAYKAGLDKGDVIITINGKRLPPDISFDDYIEQYNVGDTLHINYLQLNAIKVTSVVLKSSPKYSIYFFETDGLKPSEVVLKMRWDWLKAE